MTDTNNLTLCGRLTRDVGSDERDFGYLQSGTCFAKLSLAVNESKKGQDGNWQDYANYFEVHLYGKVAENLKPYLTKGKQILVTGSLRQERWEKDGQKNSRVVINANNVQLLGGNSENQNGYQQGGAPRFTPVNNGFQNQSTYAQQYARQNQPQNQQNGFVQEDLPYPEEIPF